MGDSCFNGGMKEITRDVGKHVGAYARCVPTGDNWVTDTINGFLKNMDASVDVFAAKIKADPQFASAPEINAMGFSQGNSLIRGYIQKYNGEPGYPVIATFLSVHGTVQGVGGFPQCNPEKGIVSAVCRALDRVLGELAYNAPVQSILFQADYYRDPFKTRTQAYKTHSQLAAWNGEASDASPDAVQAAKQRFGRTKTFVMVKALGDTMVFPNEGEHWGGFADGSYETVLRMNETDWYRRDTFGLRTADEAGRVRFEETKGNHLQFTEAELFGWIDAYF
jgi:palmitoyl-protein thioesterase